MTKQNITDKAILVAERTTKLLNEQIENNKKLWKGINDRDKQIKDLEMKLEIADTDYQEAIKEADTYKNEVCRYNILD